jgi:hypothetical protein
VWFHQRLESWWRIPCLLERVAKRWIATHQYVCRIGKPYTTLTIAGAPSLQLAVQLLDALVENVQDLANEYEQVAERVKHDTELSEIELERLQRLDWTDEVISPESTRQAFGTRNQVLYSMSSCLDVCGPY